MTPAAWRSYVYACKPDVVTALADTPFTSTSYSQKRTMKSLERSTAWLADLLRQENIGETEIEKPRLNVLVSMVGGVDPRARKAFAEGLLETLHGQDLELISPLKTLDEGVVGYVFDIIPLHMQLQAENVVSTEKPEDTEASESAGTDIASLVTASLSPLPVAKPRVAHSARCPHEVLRLIQEVGIDLFDAQWAQHAADIGVALDFTFPVRDPATVDGDRCVTPRTRDDGRADLGHNLFHVNYAHDHSRLSSYFLDAASTSQHPNSTSFVCNCAACSPKPIPAWINHSSVEVMPAIPTTPQAPFTRSYIHHLLHTHEMSSHSLLAMHNLTVVDAFFAGIREVLIRPNGLADFRDEVSRFIATYDECLVLFDEAEVEWAAVERARGKGRLQREKSSAPAPTN